MFNRILDFIGGPPEPPRPLPEADSRHLLGALLVRVAKASQGVTAEELAAIDAIFTRRFDLDPVQAAKLRADCERLSDALPPTEALGPLLIARIPPEQRFALRSALLTVARADGMLQSAEARIIHQVSQLLGTQIIENETP